MADIPPISGDPSRQATSSIRGYVYQIYQSLYVWMGLGDAQTLVLEGAEDFEVYDGPDVETTQVKDVASAITLRSSGVVDAIQHYWQYKRAQPESKIHFRFLTTANPGVEHGSPFGPGIKGLELWTRAKRPAVDVTPLVAFLMGLDLPTELKSFLNDSDPEEIRRELIEPLHWDTGQRTIEGLQSAIHNRLAIYGLRVGVPAHDSIKASGHLLQRVVETIIKPNARVLTFSDFALAFEDATGRWESRARLDAMVHSVLRQELAPLYAPGPADSSIDVTELSPVLRPPPPVVAGALTRHQVLGQMQGVLASDYGLILYGSTGLGKTTLARQFAVQSGHQWIWASFRGVDAQQVKAQLRRIIFRLEAHVPQPRIILDDLDLSGGLAAFEGEIEALAFAVSSRNGDLIITTQTRPPKHIFAKIWLPADSEYPAPYFTLEEIEALVKAHGQTELRWVTNWSKIIQLNTSGHPQLVHARVRHLQSLGWPRPKEEDFIAPSEVERERQDMQQRLIKELPSASTRSLAYRLSVHLGPFSRGTVMALANVPPAITLPGEEFQRLVGPWIEQDDEDEYRLSPLLQGAAARVLDPKEIPHLHAAIAMHLVNRRSVPIADGATALMHALIAQSKPLLLKICYNLLRIKTQDLPRAAEYFSWFGAWAIKDQQRIFASDPIVNSMLRAVQFRVTSNLDKPQEAVRIGNLWLQEIADIKAADLRDASKAFALGSILIAYNLPFRPKFIVDKLLEFIALSEKPGSGIKRTAALGVTHPKVPHAHEHPATSLMILEVARIDGLEAFNELFDALVAVPGRARRPLLRAFHQRDNFAEILFGRTWLNEVKKPEGSARACIEAFYRAAAHARTWNNEPLFVSAYVAISVLEDEYAKDAKAAIEALDYAARVLKKHPASLESQRAKVLFGQGRYAEALRIWDNLLPDWHTPDEVEPAFATRLAGIAAANSGDWAKAQSFFELGAERTKKSASLNVMKVGFRADAAFALWKNGNRANSLESLVSVVESLADVPDDGNLRNQALHARIGHTISWMLQEAGGKVKEEHVEPPPGFMSNQEGHESFESYSVRPISLVWYMLGELEKELRVDLGISERILASSERSSLPIVHITSGSVRLSRAFKLLQFDDLIELFVRALAGLKTARRMRTDGSDILSPGEIDDLSPEERHDSQTATSLIYLMLAATVALAGQTPQMLPPYEVWERQIAAEGLVNESLAAFLRGLRTLASDGDAFLLDDDASLPFYERALRAIWKAKTASLAPDDLFRAHFVMWNCLSNSPWPAFGAAELERWVVSAWVFVTEHQRFALRSPQVDVPAILEVCASTETSGLEKVARILLAAARAVGVPLSTEARDVLQRAGAASRPKS